MIKTIPVVSNQGQNLNGSQNKIFDEWTRSSTKRRIILTKYDKNFKFGPKLLMYYDL